MVAIEGGVASHPETEEAEQVLPEVARQDIMTMCPATRVIYTKSSAKLPGGVATVIPVPGGTSRAQDQSTIEISSVKQR